jgi:hypothetical protein
MNAAGFHDRDWMDEVSRRRGRRVHIATAYDDEGDLDDDSIKESDLGYIEAWRAWKKQFQPEFLFIEQPVMHKLYRFAGTLDRGAIVRFNNTPFRTCIEIKTGTAPWWGIYQTSGYTLMLPDEHLWMRLIVELHKDGSYQIVGPWGGQTHHKHEQIFLSALNIFRAKEEVGKL